MSFINDWWRNLREQNPQVDVSQSTNTLRDLYERVTSNVGQIPGAVQQTQIQEDLFRHYQQHQQREIERQMRDRVAEEQNKEVTHKDLETRLQTIERSLLKIERMLDKPWWQGAVDGEQVREGSAEVSRRS